MCMYCAIGIKHDKDKDILVHRYVVDIYVWKQMLDLHTHICETRQRISVHVSGCYECGDMQTHLNTLTLECISGQQLDGQCASLDQPVQTDIA